MNRILVTGYKGFIGQKLYKKLSLTGNDLIKGLDSNYLTKPNWTTVLKKILDDFNPNVIYHVGACSNTLEKDVNFMMTRNYESTKIISEWSYIKNAKFIYSSSASIYGVNNEYPSNLYGWSKYAGEDVAVVNGGVSLRYFNVYGPGEENKGKMASVAYQMFIKNKNKEEVKLFTGFPSRDFVYVDDVVSANIFAFKNYEELIANNSGNIYYEVGSGESRLFEDVLENLNIPYSYEDYLIPEGYQFHTKSNSELWMPNWKPKFTIETGLAKYKKYLEKPND